ncbi:MAG TPA: N-acetylneuraminate synthase [Nitrospirae bacterium]|nr:N,N'-diacetyllegionaminic acid synthase [bacterium BMS3Abin06]HDH11392.1 N-acetylneuraminate synthase [Nitrospirota bacterium]HDZ01454.1 N-acetylneuraminate synthase [Nitrospirota bacterium]
MKTFIIAEAGVNHNGKIDIARKLVDAAVDSGADAVKFQTFKAEKLVSRYAPKAEYQAQTTDRNESQYEMLKRLELDAGAFKELVSYSRKRGIVFLSTAFDLESIDFLNELDLEIFKIPSGEITNLPYLWRAGSLSKKIIISTGMADMGEIEDALDVLTEAGTPKENITVLHCNTEYPTPFEDVNLLAMQTIRDAFKIKAGYSDHTQGIEVSVAAAALGAAVIEKHFTLDKKMPGPDHSASLEPYELKAMVMAVRNIEKAIGSGIKKPSPSELKNRAAARKSIVALRNIRKGELLSEEIITTKRPGTGISPMQWDKVVGQTALKDFEADALIEI